MLWLVIALYVLGAWVTGLFVHEDTKKRPEFRDDRIALAGWLGFLWPVFGLVAAWVVLAHLCTRRAVR